jgi:hypothetical protein
MSGLFSATLTIFLTSTTFSYIFPHQGQKAMSSVMPEWQLGQGCKAWGFSICVPHSEQNLAPGISNPEHFTHFCIIKSFLVKMNFQPIL